MFWNLYFALFGLVRLIPYGRTGVPCRPSCDGAGAPPQLMLLFDPDVPHHSFYSLQPRARYRSAGSPNIIRLLPAGAYPRKAVRFVQSGSRRSTRRGEAGAAHVVHARTRRVPMCSDLDYPLLPEGSPVPDAGGRSCVARGTG